MLNITTRWNSMAYEQHGMRVNHRPSNLRSNLRSKCTADRLPQLPLLKPNNVDAQQQIRYGMSHHAVPDVFRSNH